jgi:hypothetical protein
VSPGPGGITIFPINADGTLGTPNNTNVGNNPVAIATSVPTCTATPALPGSLTGLTSPNCIVTGSTGTANNGYTNTFLYVADAEIATATPTILGFVENPKDGSLVPIAGSNSNNGFNAGVSPSSLIVDLTGKYVYMTDKAQNEIYGYQIANGTTGTLTGLVSSPFATGQYPVSITIEPRDKYVYVANYNSATVSSYTLNLANGSLGASAGSNFSTTTGPTCVTVEPELGIYLYTSDYLNASISGGQLSPNTGQLSAVADSFFPSVSQPICLVTVPNGAHAIQEVQP